MLLLVLGFAFQGTRSIWGTDEGRYVGNAIQMIDSGNYLVPAYNSQRVNFSKPPMTYWVIAGSLRVFGRNAWAARIPYALAFIFTALLVFGMGKRLVPDRPWLPPLIYASSVVPFVSANIISTDVLLTCFETLAMYGFVAWEWDARPASRRRYLLLMWLGFGLAFLTKGPPGLIVLLGVIPYLVKREGWVGVRRLFHPLGLAIFLVVGLTWYVVVVVRYPWVLHYFLHYEVYDRIFTATQHRNPQWYGWIKIYVTILFLGTLPWWPFVARSVAARMRRSQLAGLWKRAEADLFLLLWFLVPLVVFCLVKSRLPLYILPLFVPLSLLLALGLRRKVNPSAAWQRIGFAIWVVLLLAFKGGMGMYYHPYRDNLRRTQMLKGMTAGVHYDAMIFVENAITHQAVEEHTPWGIRVYIDKPIYAVAWKRSGAEQRLCALWSRQRNVILGVNSRLQLDHVHAVLRSCSAGLSIRKLGTFQRWTLEHVQRVN